MRHLDFGAAGGFFGADLRIAVGAADQTPRRALRDLGIGRAAAQEGAEVEAVVGEEAGVEPAFGGQAGAGAAAAEGLGDGRDDTDLALPPSV